MRVIGLALLKDELRKRLPIHAPTWLANQTNEVILEIESLLSDEHPNRATLARVRAKANALLVTCCTVE